MANGDPILPIINALSGLVAPNPTFDPSLPPTAWTSGSSVAKRGTPYAALQALLSLLFGLSGGLTQVGNGVNTALTEVAGLIANLANQLGQLKSVEAQLAGVFTALVEVLELTQSISPGSTASVLESVSAFFNQVQMLISVMGLSAAADELAELSQQLTAAANLFPTA
jgi:ABC-type transporter Mla subunit MlaD